MYINPYYSNIFCNLLNIDAKKQWLRRVVVRVTADCGLYSFIYNPALLLYTGLLKNFDIKLAIDDVKRQFWTLYFAGWGYYTC